MDYFYLVVCFILGILIGFVIGLTGVGGGVLVMPALTQILGISPAAAVGTASLYAFITKVYAVFEHYRLKTIRAQPSVLILFGAIPGCVLSSWIVLYFAKTLGSGFQDHLRLFIAWVMCFCAVLLIYNIFSKKDVVQTALEHEELSFSKKGVGIFLGFIVGALVGSTSVGGGVLVIPVLMMFFKVDTKGTVGTSIIIAVVLTLLTTLMYSDAGQMDYLTAIFMAVGSFLGVFLGSRLSVKLTDMTLKRIVVSVIVVATISMFFDIDH